MKLPDVTLVAVTGLGYDTEGHINALKKSSEQIEFGDVKFIQSGKIKNIDDWSKFVIYDLPNYIHTSHALLVHSDGYVINPTLWRSDWLSYDYIGSPWPLPRDDFSYRDISNNVIRVGNSVSLRSKRLMDLANDLKLPWQAFHGFYNEDGFICVNNRHIYLEQGMKFAPLEVAKYFAKENEIPENVGLKTFAFHKHRYENN